MLKRPPLCVRNRHGGLGRRDKASVLKQDTEGEERADSSPRNREGGDVKVRVKVELLSLRRSCS